jgi:phytoene desaturase
VSRISVIGAGFSGLSAAACLAKAGHEVTVFEKHAIAGGRARKFSEGGFVFDMGPSWYWMPDVFEKFFNRFNNRPSDFYQLQRLDPSYRVFFSKSDIMDVPVGTDAVCGLFESREPGSAARLRKFLNEARHKYNAAINGLIYNPGVSLSELVAPQLLPLLKLNVFGSHSAHVRSVVKDHGLAQILEFPVLFLGATPQKIPALYSLMNYADVALGTWYPAGGMHKVVEAVQAIATQQGVRFEFNSEIDGFKFSGMSIASIKAGSNIHHTDYVIASADYNFIEQDLLPPKYRQYTESYWNKRVLAPSCLIFYLGIDTPVRNLVHHNLFFDADFDLHTEQIYESPCWPTNPLFYVCCPSKTDRTVAPVGSENLFVLIPLAPGLDDGAETREKYFQIVMNRMEQLTSHNIREHVVYKKSYAINDYISDYHAFKGNAYGLANTLQQTANFKPSIRSQKLKNLFYTGQLTVPGPGVPPSIISGQVVANELLKIHRRGT